MNTDARLFDAHILQYTSPGQDGEADVVIGLDFGTSASKVVIQAHGLPGNPAYAVDFGTLAHSSMPYLLPTRLWVSEDGTCNLARTDNGRQITDLKLELFTDNENLNSNSGPSSQALSPEVVAVAYLALVLRLARRWFLESKRDVVGHLKGLNWGVNLGVPSPCIEENEENDRFRRVGKAAWILSVIDNEITLGKAQDKLRQIAEVPDYFERDDNGVACDFAIIPEIAAGAIGYAFSDLRREGLHLMVDVGASTMDVCSFVLHSPEGTDRYELLTADVKRLGTIRLHHERIRAISDAHATHAQELRDKHDPMSPISADREEYLLSKEATLAAVDEGETSLKGICERMIRRIVRDAWMRRDPNAAAWKTELPVLLIGGGGRAEFFRQIVDELNPWLRRIKNNDGTDSLQVNVPDTVCSKTTEHDRLVVAWGLSHQEFNIGQITPADKIPDIEPPPSHSRWQSRFVGKDQV